MFYEYLPLIDEHNRQRQSILNMERKWCTKDVWFRLLTTMTGMCVVGMNRCYINVKETIGGIDYSISSAFKDDLECDGKYELAVTRISDMLCANLE